MKKLVIALFTLPFVLSCSGGGDVNSTKNNFKEGIIRVEIEHEDFSGDIEQKNQIITVHRKNKGLRNLKIKGTDQFFKLDEETIIEAPFPINRCSATFKATTDKKLTKKLVYETSEKIDGFGLIYDLEYSVDKKSNINQEIPVKVKLYVDGELKREGDTSYKIEVDEDGSSRGLFSLIYVATVNSLVLN